MNTDVLRSLVTQTHAKKVFISLDMQTDEEKIRLMVSQSFQIHQNHARIWLIRGHFSGLGLEGGKGYLQASQ